VGCGVSNHGLEPSLFRAFANPHAVQKETTDCHGLNRLPRMISARNSRLSVFSSRRNADQTARLGNASVPACWMPSCPVGCLPRCPAARRATATQRRSPGVAPCDPGTRRFRTARADGRNHCLSRNQRRIHQLRGGCSAGDGMPPNPPGSLASEGTGKGRVHVSQGEIFWKASAYHLLFQASGRPNSPFSPCGRRGQGG
jgi:hypothetical protein